MKIRSKLLCQLIVALSIPVITGVAYAQDKAAPPKVDAPKVAEAPKKEVPIRKELIDNESVNVVDVTFKPGDVSTSRARPGRVVHFLTSGQLQVTTPDGKSEVRKFKAGETVWRAAETTEYKNTSKTTVRLIQVIPKAK